MFSRTDGVKFGGSGCARSATPLAGGRQAQSVHGRVPAPCRLGWSCLLDICGDQGRPALRQTAFSMDQAFQRDELMSAFQEHKEELEHYEQMFGRERGRLAVSLDRITNALVLAGQHGVYCTSQRNPAVPAMDLRIIYQELVHAKELVQSVMEELRRAKQPPTD